MKLFFYSYAIGGLAGGEDKDSFWRVVAQCTAALPEDKPRYVMVHLTFEICKIMLTNFNLSSIVLDVTCFG